MKTIITITIFHDSPIGIELLKEHIKKLCKHWLGAKEISVWHENQ